MEALIKLNWTDKSDPDYTESTRDAFIRNLRVTCRMFPSSFVLKVLKETPLCSSITSVNLCDIMKLYPEEPGFATEVFNVISIKADSIREFYIVGGPKVLHSPPKIEESMWIGISQMASLKKVKITNYYFTMEGLTQMCGALRHLLFLDVFIHPDSDYFEGNDRDLPKLFRQCFGQLKHFYFSSLWIAIGGERFQEQLTKFCVEHLRCLQDVGDPDYLVDMTSLCKNSSKTSQLRQLNLWLNRFEQEDCQFDKFPDVTCLFIGWSGKFVYRPIRETKMHLLRNFSKLTMVKMVNLDSLDYQKFFMDAYGAKLTTLMSLSTQESKMKVIDLKLIQQLCPELRRMKLFCLFLSNDCSSMRDFTKLKDILINFKSDSSDICLSDLLSPPALQSVVLMRLNTSRKELQITMDKMKRKEILGNIQLLLFRMIVGGGAKMRRAIRAKGDEFVQELVKMRPKTIADITIEGEVSD